MATFFSRKRFKKIAPPPNTIKIFLPQYVDRVKELEHLKICSCSCEEIVRGRGGEGPVSNLLGVTGGVPEQNFG